MTDFSKKKINIVSEDSADPYYGLLESEKKHTTYETTITTKMPSIPFHITERETNTLAQSIFIDVSSLQ